MSGIGALSHIGIAFQDSYGTAVTSASQMDYAPFISESLTEEIEHLVDEGIRGRFEKGNAYEGIHNVSGEINLEVPPLLVGKLLKGWFGQSSGTLVGSVYTHQFIPRTSDFDNKAAVPPMTIEVFRDAGSAFIYYDALINTLNVEIANGEIVKATAGFVGGSFQWGNKTTPSYGVGSLFTWNVASLSIAGTAVDIASQISLNFNQNLEARHTLNLSRFASRVKRNGPRMLEIAGTVLFEDDVQTKVFRARTQQRMILTLTGESITTSQSNLLKFDVPQMLYTAYAPNVGGMGLMEVGFSAEAMYDNTSSYLCEVSLVNTKSAY